MTAKELIDKGEEYDLGYLIQSSKRRGWLIAKYEQQINSFHEKFPEIELCVMPYNITLNRPERDAMLAFIQCFGGDWNKQIEDYDKTKMRYVQKVDDGIEFQVTFVDPPPNCEIVEEEVLVAAVPEHTEKRKVVKCKPSQENIQESEQNVTPTPSTAS